MRIIGEAHASKTRSEYGTEVRYYNRANCAFAAIEDLWAQRARNTPTTRVWRPEKKGHFAGAASPSTPDMLGIEKLRSTADMSVVAIVNSDDTRARSRTYASRFAPTPSDLPTRSLAVSAGNCRSPAPERLTSPRPKED